MSKAVWKFGLHIADMQPILMPAGAKVLCCDVQHGFPQVWALVDPSEQQHEQRMFRTCGTGHPLPKNPGDYVGTYQMHDGSLVFHVFEIKE